MAGPLQRPQHHELQQAADVQARRRRVEAAVVGDRPLGEVRRAARPRRCSGRSARGGAARRSRRVTGRHPARRPARRGLPPGRNTLTDGASVSQNRHGRSVARLMPTRGPAETADRRRPAVQPHRRCPGRAGRRPCRRGPMASAWVSRAGPRARSRGDPGGRTARPGQLLPHHDLAGPQQHRRAAPSRPDDDVRAPVHAVAEVDVEPPGRAEHDLGARRRAAVRVRRRVHARPPSTPRPRSAAAPTRPSGRSVTTQQPSRDGATTSTGPSRSSSRTSGPGSGRSGRTSVRAPSPERRRHR